VLWHLANDLRAFGKLGFPSTARTDNRTSETASSTTLGDKRSGRPPKETPALTEVVAQQEGRGRREEGPLPFWRYVEQHTWWEGMSEYARWPFIWRTSENSPTTTLNEQYPPSSERGTRRITKTWALAESLQRKLTTSRSKAHLPGGHFFETS
jgi:hypothetical protein